MATAVVFSAFNVRFEIVAPAANLGTMAVAYRSLIREVAAQQHCRAVVEPGVASQAPTCLGIQACLKRSLPSSILQVSCARKSRQITRAGNWSCGRWTPQECQPSSSSFCVLPESFRRIAKRHSERLKGSHFKDKYSQLLPHKQAALKAEGKSGNEGYSTLELIEDDARNGDPVLEDQFNRFTMAMASQDDRMAEQIMEEMGYSVDIGEVKGLVNEVSKMQEQLQELHEQVQKLMEEGDKDSARGLIEANFEALMEQLESGYRGMEQIAMLDALAQLRMSLGEFEEAEYLLGQIKDVMEVVGIDSLQPLADRILEHMGSMYTTLGKPAEGLPYYLKSVEIQEDLVGEDSPLIIKTLLGLATAYTDMDESTSSIKVYNRVLSIIEKTRGPTDESLALPLSKLGHCLLEEGRADEAESAMSRALKLLEQRFGANDGRVGIAKCALARTYASKGAVDESISLYQEGLQIMEGCSRLSDGDPSMETARTDLAELLNLVDRNDEAEELWEENLRVKERLFGPNHPSLAVHLQNLATAYAVSGKHDKSEPLLRRSLKLTVEELGPDAPQVSVPLEFLATALHHLGRQGEAEPIARRALQIREAAFGPDSAIVGEACNCLASILHAIGNHQEALKLMKRVLAIQEEELGPDSPTLVLTLELIIMLLDKLGRIEEIEPLYFRLAMLRAADCEGEDAGDAIVEGFDAGNFGYGGIPAPASLLDAGDDDDIIDI